MGGICEVWNWWIFFFLFFLLNRETEFSLNRDQAQLIVHIHDALKSKFRHRGQTRWFSTRWIIAKHVAHSHVSPLACRIQGARRCAAGLMHSWLKKKKKKKKKTSPFLGTNAQSSRIEEKERAGIFSPPTVRSVLNNGAAECGHADTVKGFCCISLIWCQWDEGMRYVIAIHIFFFNALCCPHTEAHTFSITMFSKLLSLQEILLTWDKRHGCGRSQVPEPDELKKKNQTKG